MRVAGIHGRDSAAVSCFIGLMTSGLAEDDRKRVRTLAFPSENPIVAALVCEDRNPPVQWSSRPDGSFAILDGEIYNAAELHPRENGSGANDANTLLDLYFAGGWEAFARVDAGASIVIWDAPAEELLLFRDRSGMVPIFHANASDSVMWASDIASLLRAGVPANINLLAVDFFLANGFVAAPWTFVEQIKKVPPAHMLRCSKGGSVDVQRYWRPVGRPKLDLSAEETNERLKVLIEQSLRRRYSSDVQTGVLLSGGVDSKLIVAALRRLLGASVDTFTYHYAKYDGYLNEHQAARQCAEYFDTRHHEITLGPSDIADKVEWMVRSYGEPFTYGLHSARMNDVVKADISVLLTGAGSDGWFVARRNHYGLRYARLPSPLQRIGQAAVPLLRRLNADTAELAEAVSWCAETGFPAHCGSMVTPDRLRAKLYSDIGMAPVYRRATEQLLTFAAEDHAQESDRDKITFVHQHFMDAECLFYLYHSWGRAHELGIRHPFMDGDLFAFAMRLPRAQLDKVEVRRLAATLMPHEMAYPTKIGQGAPIGHWFRCPLRDFLRDQLRPARIKEQGLFNNEVVQQLVGQHLNGAKHGMRLWALVTVVVWNDLMLRQKL